MRTWKTLGLVAITSLVTAACMGDNSTSAGKTSDTGGIGADAKMADGADVPPSVDTPWTTGDGLTPDGIGPDVPWTDLPMTDVQDVPSMPEIPLVDTPDEDVAEGALFDLLRLAARLDP